MFFASAEASFAEDATGAYALRNSIFRILNRPQGRMIFS